MGIAGKTSTMKGTILTVLVLLVASCQMKSTKHFLVETKTLTKDEPSGEDYFGGSNFIGGGYGGGQGGRGYGGGHQVGGPAGGQHGGFASGGNTNNINLGGLGGNGYGNGGAKLYGGAQSVSGSNVGGSMNSIG